ncbi:MAG: hypothetical protein ACKVZH_18630 [Blastocatellia bacterium]
MQCPSCRNEIAENQFYCPVCRASVYSYTPENSPGNVSKSQVGRAGQRLLEVLLILIFIGVGIVLARAIKWKELINNFLPGFVTAPAENSGTAPSSQPASSGKKSAAKAVKSPEEKPVEPTEPAPTESVRDLKQKIEELPASAESKPTPKPTAQPTPKPPSNNP